jgi:AraC family transcriptional regulator of adaptative response/methylated-DNA-[protein]-cysteine methyltransferase
MSRALQLELVQRACQYIEARVENEPTLSEISAHVHVSPYHLQRTFKRFVGLSPREYSEWHRLGKLKSRLRDCDSVTTALYDAGYGSSSRLYERSNASLGMTPATYSRGGEGMSIHYVTIDCYLGRLLVAATERGICAVHLGRNDAELVGHLSREYPAAHIEPSQTPFCDWVEKILDYIKGRLPHLDLPLDVQSTAFEGRVWQALRDIPFGESRTYGQIAESIGVPGAEEEVAWACYANPTAILVPCHRAERDDGQVSELYTGREVFSWETLKANERQIKQGGE